MKEWLFYRRANKKYNKQQLLKAVKLSYINRKKKLKEKKLFPISYYDIDGSNKKSEIELNKYISFNINWLLKDKYSN